MICLDSKPVTKDIVMEMFNTIHKSIACLNNAAGLGLKLWNDLTQLFLLHQCSTNTNAAGIYLYGNWLLVVEILQCACIGYCLLCFLECLSVQLFPFKLNGLYCQCSQWRKYISEMWDIACQIVTESNK